MINPATIDSLIAATTSPFRFDRAAFLEQASPPLPGSAWYQRHQRVVRRAKALTLPMPEHSFDPCHSVRAAITQILGGDARDTVNTLADRTIPADPLLALRKALMQMIVSIEYVDERVVCEDPDLPARNYMSDYVPISHRSDCEAMYDRTKYRMHAALFLEGLRALPPLAATLASNDIRQQLVNCCHGMVQSHVKDLLALMYDAAQNEDLEIILDREQPENFSYRYLQRTR